VPAISATRLAIAPVSTDARSCSKASPDSAWL
jgi:hypothetical protein